jgi:hypothetical protein
VKIGIDNAITTFHCQRPEAETQVRRTLNIMTVISKRHTFGLAIQF